MCNLKLTEVYTPHLFPSLILFIGPDKYLDLEGDVLSSLIQPKKGLNMLVASYFHWMLMGSGWLNSFFLLFFFNLII